MLKTAVDTPSSPTIRTPLSDEALSKLSGILQTFIVNLPKCQDSGDFHVSTVHLDSAVEVSFLLISFLIYLTSVQQSWCLESGRSLYDLPQILTKYDQLGGLFNKARTTFKRVGYLGLLIPDQWWADLWYRPQIVPFLFTGVETPEMLVNLQGQAIAQRAAEAPRSLV